MNILGIETSCDETAASIVKDGRVIVSNVVASSLKHHTQYGGIIPEIASRKQLDYIYPVVTECLDNAGLTLKNISAVAVTGSPGLIGSLLVGKSYAHALAFALKKPLITVDHIQAHLYANFLRFQDEKRLHYPKLPAIGLIVSGGHTSLYLIKDLKHFRLLGHTRDDAAGEAFDKVARILDLGYPGGPVIDQRAQACPDPKLRFTPAKLKTPYDFSFSGVKTAVLYHHKKHSRDTAYDQNEVCAAFQNCVVQSLVTTAFKACDDHNIKTLIIGGGVAANTHLRKTLNDTATTKAIDFFCPPIPLCMDNAAMVAGWAFHLHTSHKGA